MDMKDKKALRTAQPVKRQEKASVNSIRPAKKTDKPGTAPAASHPAQAPAKPLASDRSAKTADIRSRPVPSTPAPSAGQTGKSIAPRANKKSDAKDGAERPYGSHKSAAEQAKADAIKDAALDVDNPIRVKLSSDELREKMKELMKLARDQGYLTHGDIHEALPTDLIDPDELDGFILMLRGMDIEIIDSANVDLFAPDGPGSVIDPVPGGRDLQAHRGGGSQFALALQAVRIFHGRLFQPGGSTGRKKGAV